MPSQLRKTQDTASPTEFKCINCLTYNKYNQNKNICTNHSSLDKNCPSLQAILEKYSKTQITEMADFRNTNTVHCNRSNKMQTQIRCIKINLQHSRIETDNIMKITEEDSTDILCIQEPYIIQTKMAGI